MEHSRGFWETDFGGGHSQLLLEVLLLLLCLWVV
jgi:hypothetical protein